VTAAPMPIKRPYRNVALLDEQRYHSVGSTHSRAPWPPGASPALTRQLPRESLTEWVKTALFSDSNMQVPLAYHSNLGQHRLADTVRDVSRYQWVDLARSLCAY
jgi:hypothetical protein